MSFKEFLKSIISVQNKDAHKIFTILGIKFKFLISKRVDESYASSLVHRDWLLSLNGLAFENFLNSRLKDNNQTYQEFIEDLFKTKNIACSVPNQSWSVILKNLKVIFKNLKFIYSASETPCDKLLFWGTQDNEGNICGMYNATVYQTQIAVVENSFLTTMKYDLNGAKKGSNENFYSFISFIFDNKGTFYDARKTNYLEEMLNNPNFVVTDEQLERARKCIKKIVDNYLSKYNNQPVYTPKIGREGVKKVLVIDQSYGDASIRRGMATSHTFEQMLQDAIAENPDADIIVKTHPDTKTGAGGYFTGLKQHDNVYPMTDLINPISLLKYCDKVYVCTSQFGFEALMCGKDVKVYGMPFYAGWGLTQDLQKCPRRTNKRSLEEIFYITYIVYTHWVNPETNSRCEIEEAIDYLIKLRGEFFKENGVEYNV